MSLILLSTVASLAILLSFHGPDASLELRPLLRQLGLTGYTCRSETRSRSHFLVYGAFALNCAPSFLVAVVNSLVQQSAVWSLTSCTVTFVS